MSEDIVYMRVNWSTGMLLTPEHFAQQDRALDAAAMWGWRHLRDDVGLVGPGARVHDAFGSPAHDPQLLVSDDGQVLRLTLRQLRAITPAGAPVEIGEASAVRGEFPRTSLGGSDALMVYCVRSDETEPDPGSVGADAANPALPARRRQHFELRLDLPAELAANAVVVGRVRRAARTARFELDPEFIPACAMLLAHSRLYAAWRRSASALALLAADFAELHRLVSRYIDQLLRRGLDVRIDLDVLSFVERTVLAMDACASEVTEPAESPARFFRSVARSSSRTALALDLSPATRSYFQTLAGADAHYAALLEAQREALSYQRDNGALDDLQVAVDAAERTVARLQHLRDALAAKYVDYRINRSVDSLRFLLDDGGEKFFGAVATPGHPQRDGDVVTFVFSDLELAAQQEYRVVLVGDPGAQGWRVGEELSVTARFNASMGGGRPITRPVACGVVGQRNFALDLDPPAELGVIKTLDVSVAPGGRIRGAQLFQRRRGVVADAGILGAGAGAVARPAPVSAPPAPPPPPPPPSPRAEPSPATPLPVTPANPSGPQGAKHIKINIKKERPT